MGFRIAHLSDIHAGYSSGRATTSEGVNVRADDGYRALRFLIDDVLDVQPDCVLICGDVFHTPTPDMRSIVEVQEQLRRLTMPTYILTGNHDTNDVRADVSAARILNDPERQIYAHAEPYVSYEIADGVVLHMVSHHAFTDQEETMSSIKPIDGAVNIFATHGSVMSHGFKLHTDASPREVVVPDDLLQGWDYALLGHIHSRGWVDDKVFYNGSLIRRGFSDAPGDRGWTLWDISGKDFTKDLRCVPQRPQYDFDLIDAVDMTPTDVTDLIVSRLSNTDDGSIVRQKVLGASVDRLDTKAIKAAAAHTLSWQLVSKPMEKEIVVEKESVGSTDVVSSFDEWTGLYQWRNIDESDRTTVTTRVRECIESGMEKTLED